MPRIDHQRLTNLLAPADLEGATSSEKGAALETAIRFLFEQIPGVSCRMQGALGVFATEEVDLLFANMGSEDGLSGFDPELLVECKNWSRPVGADEVNWFATKLRRRNRECGVLVAANGVTGTPEARTAALQEIVLALNEGQAVLVLTRDEIEALQSGEQLAALLLKKRHHLIGRTDIYVADPDELRTGVQDLRRGWEAFAEILRGERLQRIEEALDEGVQAPADRGAGKVALTEAAKAVGEAVARAQAHPAADSMWDGVRHELLHLAAICAAWIRAHGWTTTDGILANIQLSGVDRLRVSTGSRLWTTLMTYYLGELDRERPEVPLETILFALLGMAVEELWVIDDYSPEPDEYEMLDGG